MLLRTNDGVARTKACGRLQVFHSMRRSVTNFIIFHCGPLSVDLFAQAPFKKLTGNALAGNSAEICGGVDAISLYFLRFQHPAISHVGCFEDGGQPILPHQALITHAAITNGLCSKACFGLGFSAAGLRAGQSCFCGSASALEGAVRLDLERCGIQCRGNANETCGGAGALDVFTLAGYSAEVR